MRGWVLHNLIAVAVMIAPWTDAERRAWSPPEDLTVSEWADRYRVLPVGISSEPGPWRTDRTPYLRAIMDVMGDDTTQEVVIMKTPQVGLSEATRNALGYWIDHDPAPTMIVFPTDPTAKENLAERVIPMIEATPRLRMYLTEGQHDLKQTSLTLRSMAIYGAHAGSPSSLATRPCRYVVCDETDKYPAFSGKETDAIRLAGHRQTTYAHRRKLIKLSTPTTKHGHIYKAFELVDPHARFTFHVPCPGCKAYQPLRWAQLRWDSGKTQTAGGPVPDDEVARNHLASRVLDGQVRTWYQCAHCDREIPPMERHGLVAQGRWVSEKGTSLDAIPADERPSCLAFHITALYSPWVEWAKVVSVFLTSRSDHTAMMDFMNGYLGEPFEEELNKLEASVFEQKANKGHARGVVPAWARFLICGADTGGRDAWYTIRAFGPNYRSRLIDWGHVHSLDELKQRGLNTRFQVEGNVRPEMSVDLMVLDSGGTYDVMDEHASRTDQVYRFSVQDRRIAVVKGTDRGERPISPRRVTFKPPNGQAPYDVILNLVNVHYYKDVLSARIHELRQGIEVWQECQGIDDSYCRHMTAEHRILEREGNKVKMVWRPITKGLPNHLWDCSVYACAGADMIRVDLLPPDDLVPGALSVVGRTPTTRVDSTEVTRRPLITRRIR